MTSFQPGDVLGRYRLERKLGEGAMGEVYLARDPHIDRPVAVKTLLLHGVKESEIADRKERMMREARAAGCILHPHVVTLFDAGHHEGHFFLAFEFVEGGDLSKKLEAGPLPVGEALRYVREACLGLGHAHGLGIVHRDIKPSNLMLDGRGKIKISDFGIAKMAGQGTELTVTGTVVGSPHYLSPEQVRDQPLDGRSDLFSLGVVFYEMLTGARPFEGETISTLIYKILDTEPPPLAGLEAGLEPRLPTVLARMLAKDREERFPDAAAVAAELAILERELPPEVLAHPARLPATPTDPTVALSTDQAEPPTGADGGAVAGTALRQPGEPETGDGVAAPGATRGTGAEPEPAPAAPFVPPPPPDRGAPPAGADAPPAPSAPPSASSQAAPAATSSPTASPTASPTSGAADGGTYAVPSLRSRSRLRRTLLLATLLVTVVVAAVFVVNSRDDAPEERQLLAGQQDAGSEQEDVGGATWPPPPPAGEGGSEGGAGAEPGDDGAPGVTPPPQQGRPDGLVESAVVDTPEVAQEVSATSLTPTFTPTSTPTSSEATARPDAEPAAGTTRQPTRPDPTPRLTDPGRGTLDTPGTDLEAASRGPSGGEALPTPDARLDTGTTLTFDVTPPDAFVLVDGTVIGRAAEYGQRRGRSYELPSAGRHRVTLRRDGMRDYHLQVDASGGATSVVRARMTPLSAREIPFHELEQHRVREAIALRVDPPTARVLVDGEPKGRARQYAGGRFRRGGWLELPLGQHRITLMAPGRKRVDLAVDVTSGAREDRKRIEVTMPRDSAP